MILIYIYLTIGLILAVLFTVKGFKQHKKLAKGDIHELDDEEVTFFNDVDWLKGFMDIRIMICFMFLSVLFGWVFMVTGSLSYKGKKIF